MSTPSRGQVGDDADVIVVGAGPAGLAAGAALRERGIEAVLLDGSPVVGDSWRRRYDRLHLNTSHRLSRLFAAGRSTTGRRPLVTAR